MKLYPVSSHSNRRYYHSSSSDYPSFPNPIPSPFVLVFKYTIQKPLCDFTLLFRAIPVVTFYLGVLPLLLDHVPSVVGVDPAHHLVHKLPFSSKMCKPFAPEIKPLSPEVVAQHKLHKCFSFDAYPLGKRNHVHVTFRQWPAIGEEHCKDFIATNVSFIAMNSHGWPFGRWMTKSIKESAFCDYEDDDIENLVGITEDCNELMKLKYVSNNSLITISQDPATLDPERKVNIFKFSINNTNENKGGICSTWSYNGKNYPVIAAANLGGLSNTMKYFAHFRVTFLAELLVNASKETNISHPFWYSLQTNTLAFDGLYKINHHKSDCHYYRTEFNFKRQPFSQDLNQLPPEYRKLLNGIYWKAKKQEENRHTTTTTPKTTETTATPKTIETTVRMTPKITTQKPENHDPTTQTPAEHPSSPPPYQSLTTKTHPKNKMR